MFRRRLIIVLYPTGSEYEISSVSKRSASVYSAIVAREQNTEGGRFPKQSQNLVRIIISNVSANDSKMQSVAPTVCCRKAKNSGLN